jgi:hypothetical protein
MVSKYGTFRVVMVSAGLIFGVGLLVLLINPQVGASPLR